MKLDIKAKQRIRAIVEEFDFEKVHKAMVAMDWKWASSEDDRTPSISTMVCKAIEILNDAVEYECNVGSGGFEAVYIRDEDDYNIELMFVIDSVNSLDVEADANAKKEGGAE